MKDNDVECKKICKSKFFLRKDKIKPGDVLLTGTNKICGNIIKLATKSNYSHAAVWILMDGFDDSSELVLVEADSSGVIPTWNNKVVINNESDIFYPLQIDVTSACLLRHPKIDDIDYNKIKLSCDKLVKNDLYKEYSKLLRLIFPLNVLSESHKLNLMNITDQGLSIKGAFCSELVGIFYDYMELQLFDGDIKPCFISPALLFSKESFLVEVSDVIIDRDAICNSNEDIFEYVYGFERKDDALSKSIIEAHKVNNKISEIERIINYCNKKTTLELVDLVNHEVYNLIDNFNQCQQVDFSEEDKMKNESDHLLVSHLADINYELHNSFIHIMNNIDSDVKRNELNSLRTPYAELFYNATINNYRIKRRLTLLLLKSEKINKYNKKKILKLWRDYKTNKNHILTTLYNMIK